MKLAFLTPGTGSYYCGACMRDNALAKALVAAGHEVSLLPMYLPLELDEEAFTPRGTPVFFGGINVYLQQKVPLFRHTPGWLDRMLNTAGLLRAAARRSHMTSPGEHGAMALAMLEIEASPFGKETGKLLDWLEGEQPQVVVLSNALLAGFIRTLRERLGCRVIACFQGEDSFLDGLPDPYRRRCWEAMHERVAEADLLVSPSEFYAGLMRRRFAAPDLPISIMPNGVAVSPSAPRPPRSAAPVIGYLARMIREKGVELLVDAFIHLRRELGHPDARLHVAGSMTEADRPLVVELQGRIGAAGLSDSVRWSPNIDHGAKQDFFSGLSLFSVPATYHEAFGLYAVEALAAGVPLVQPNASSFPEIIGSGGAGVLFDPGDPVALATAWHDLLADPERLGGMRENALRSARESFSVEAMCDRFLALAGPLAGTGSP